MLGDATVYAFSLFVLNRSAAWRTGVVRLKGAVMAAFGLGVIGQVIANAVLGSVPVAKTMGGIGFLALCANLLCLLLLLRHRNDDLNMRSMLLCSHKDAHAQDRHHQDSGHHSHIHTHGAIDPGILDTQQGIAAIKWSLLVLLVTALVQLAVVFVSNSTALLADAIHNFTDCATAFPL